MLDRVLDKLPKADHPGLIVGPESLDDAGVFRLRDDLALVQTLDFFTPIVDDPFDYGRVAAANSLSDVYAMGGTPVTAMNIVAFPGSDLPEEALALILQGAAEVCHEAGVAVAGGHSVTDRELKFGLSVTGTVHPDRITTNAGARPGEVLVLTKPLGTGLISNAMINGRAEEAWVEEMVASMVTLNDAASEEALAQGARGVTDVTGFGLIGHAREMARASGVHLTLFTGELPVLEGAEVIAASGDLYSGGERRNLAFAGAEAEIEEEVPESERRLVSDPQTSGGLLVALARDRAESYLDALRRRGGNGWIVGRVDDGPAGRLRIQRRP